MRDFRSRQRGVERINDKLMGVLQSDNNNNSSKMGMYPDLHLNS